MSTDTQEAMTLQKISTRKYRYSPLTRYGRNLLRKINRAIDKYDLIKEGDRVCVSVSGGKDSLSLLNLLFEHRRFYPAHYEISAIHVVSDFNPNAEHTRDYLAGLFKTMEVEYAFETMEVTKDKEGNEQNPGCFFCAWKRRETVFKHCVKTGCNKLAFGHHSDDVAETTLLNLVYHGNLETILPTRSFFDGKFDVIRPLFYVREKDLAYYSKLAGFETGTCVCPNDDSGKRKMMKEVVRGLTKEARNLHVNLTNASLKWHEVFDDRPLHTKAKKGS